MCKRNVLVVALVACLAGWIALPGAGQEKKGPNVLSEPPKDLKETPESKGLHNIQLAYSLIHYGRANKHAESLLIAAQILASTPTEVLKGAHTSEKSGDQPKKAVAVPKVDNSPKALLAEAKKMSSSAAVEALAAATQKVIDEGPRGAAKGPQVDGPFVIQPGETVNWKPLDFIGGQTAEALIVLDKGINARMIFEVIDQNNNVIGRDNIPGDYYALRWVPSFTGPFRFRLMNLDAIPYKIVMGTN